MSHLSFVANEDYNLRSSSSICMDFHSLRFNYKKLLPMANEEIFVFNYICLLKFLVYGVLNHATCCVEIYT
jgi:hypothetical protein